MLLANAKQSETTQTSASVFAPRIKTNGWFSDTPALRTNLILFTSCALLTIWLTWAAVTVENTHLQIQGFFYDPASYYIRNIDAYAFFQKHGWFAALIHELATDARCPGRIFPYLLLAPGLLTQTMGHLWTEIPYFLAFLTLFASTVQQRTKSTLFAIAAASLFCGLSFLYSAKLGLGAYWLDFTSACSLGCVALALIRYASSQNQRWLIASGAFASTAILCRWSAACYVLLYLLVAAPAVLGATASKSGKFAVKDALLLAVAAVPGLLFFLFFYQTNSTYYKEVGYAFSAPIGNSIAWTFHALKVTFGEPIFAIVCWLSTINCIRFLIRRDKLIAALSLWLPVSALVFLCFVARAVDGFHPTVYLAPAFFISAFCPLNDIREHRKWWHFFSGALLVLAAMSSWHSYTTFNKFATEASPAAREQKQCDVALAKFIVSTNSKTFAQFSRESVMPRLEAFYGGGFLCKGKDKFSEHESYLRLEYPNQSPKEMAQTALEELNQSIALVSVFDEATQADKPGIFDNACSASVAHHISERVKHDPAWKKVGTVPSPRGLLAVYQNSRPLDANP